MSDLGLCLEVVSRSCQPLRYNIFDAEYLGNCYMLGSKGPKWHIGYQMVTWRDRWRHV